MKTDMQFVWMPLLAVLAGCFSTSRHVASVRTETVKASADLKGPYRIAELRMNEPQAALHVKWCIGVRDENRRKYGSDVEAYAAELARHHEKTCREYGYECSPDVLSSIRAAARKDSQKDRLEKIDSILTVGRIGDVALLNYGAYGWGGYDLGALDKKLEEYANAKEACEREIRNRVARAIEKKYPGMFTESTTAKAISIRLDWSTQYETRPNYGGIGTYWLVPIMADQTTVYKMSVYEGERVDAGSTSANLIGTGNAVRESGIWETTLLPIGFIPVPGESDYDKTFCFMRSGKDSLVNKPSEQMKTPEIFKNLVFEPKVDGDVLAAALVRVLNRHAREQRLLAEREGGSK